MNSDPICIAVSGLHRGENPQPGSSIIRSLRRHHSRARIVGLAYDAMESGIYAEDGPDETFLLPYPTAGTVAFFDRVDAIRQQNPFTLFIPTLDAEIEILCHVPHEFARRGVRVRLPAPRSLNLRAKQNLPVLATACDVRVPETRVATDVLSAHRAAAELDYPLVVKGPFYEAKVVHNAAQLSASVTHLLAEWGGPVILQRRVTGPEFNALGLGDGHGGITGLCCIRKTLVSDKGKGLGGVVIADSVLTDLCQRMIAHLRWNGPFEIEVICDESTGEYVLIEMNPRFPAWVDFPSMLGANFPAALVGELRERPQSVPLPACLPGSFYLRHQIEVTGHVSSLAGLLHDASAIAPVPSVPQPFPLLS